MFESKNVLFGKVTACDKDNTLTVRLENGEVGKVAMNEIGRRVVDSDTSFGWMIGHRFGFYAGETDDNNMRLLSKKAYEEDLYRQIVNSFQSKERNVYEARFVSIYKSGALAFYELAQGVVATVALYDFCTTRIGSFFEIDMPQTLAVAIKSIDPQGRLSLYARCGFGDFAYSVRKLSLAEGTVVDGFATDHLAKGNVSFVSIAPNMLVLTKGTRAHTWVKVKIKSVIAEEQRVKAELCEDAGTQDGHPECLAFSDWCTRADSLPAYIDTEAFDKRLLPKMTEKAAPVTETPRKEDTVIDYSIRATVSPYALREGEAAVPNELHNGNPGKIIFEWQHGYLTQEHKQIALAINELRFATSWHLQRYLHLKYGITLSVKNLKKMLDHLCKLDIINSLRFKLDDQISAFMVYYPSATLFHSFTGSRRNLPDYAYCGEPDPAWIKRYLSSDQLMIGFLNGYDVKDVQHKVNMRCGENLHIRACHRIETADGSIWYLESFRRNMLDSLPEKLERYDTYFKATGEKAKVAITVDDEDLAAKTAEKIAGMRLGCEVSVTHDLKCLPLPEFRTIPASIGVQQASGEDTAKAAGLFRRFRDLFRDKKTA